MARLPNSEPFFIKVLVRNFAKEIKIPPAFVKNFKGNVPTKVFLESHAGEGRSWHVKVQHHDGRYYFCGGWPAFVRDHGLEERDFLIFTMLGSSTFFVRVVATNCCEKKVTVAPRRKRGRPSLASRPEDTPSSSRGASTSTSKKERGATVRREMDVDDDAVIISESPSKCPSCEVLLKPYQSYSIIVPTSFAQVAGLTEKSSTLVEDPRGRMWTVGILEGQGQGYTRLSAGWTSFWRENDLAPGDRLLFQFIARTDTIRIKIVNRAGDASTSSGKRNKHEVTPTRRGTSTFSSKRERGAAVRRERNYFGDDVEIIEDSPSDYPSFEVSLKRYQIYYILVPRFFAQAAGLTEERGTVMIEDPRGRMRTIGFLETQGRIRLSAGWCSFQKENGLVKGDRLLFQFIPSRDSIRIQIVKDQACSRNGKIKGKAAVNLA